MGNVTPAAGARGAATGGVTFVLHAVDAVGAKCTADLPNLVSDTDGELLFEVEAILRHRRRGRSYQFLTMLKGAPRHEAQWQPTRDFVDSDGTLTASFAEYITVQWNPAGTVNAARVCGALD